MIVTDLDTLEPGMVLAEPAFDLHHSLLLRAGAMLDARRIRLLKSWGVARVAVAGSNAVAGSAAAGPEVVNPLPENPDRKIVTTEQDPLLAEVFRVAAAIAMEKSQHEDASDR